MNPIILAIDTTAAYGSIALVRAGAGGAIVEEEVPMHSPDGFGQILFQHIAELLARHQLTPFDIACYASATGPGSFTGVRIGLSAAKGLAESAGAKVAGVSNLRAIAFYGQSSAPVVRAAILDARRGEIYGGLYDASLSTSPPDQRQAAERVAPFASWLDSLPASGPAIEFVTQDPAIYAPVLAADPRFAASPVSPAPRALAAAIGSLAARDGAFLDPAALDANYVRRSDAELFWKEA